MIDLLLGIAAGSGIALLAQKAHRDRYALPRNADAPPGPQDRFSLYVDPRHVVVYAGDDRIDLTPDAARKLASNISLVDERRDR